MAIKRKATKIDTQTASAPKAQIPLERVGGIAITVARLAMRDIIQTG